jgi:hypothetical protein
MSTEKNNNMSSDRIVLPDEPVIDDFELSKKTQKEDKKPHFSVELIAGTINNIKKHREDIEAKIEKIKEELNSLYHSRTAAHAQNLILADLLKKIDIK